MPREALIMIVEKLLFMVKYSIADKAGGCLSVERKSYIHNVIAHNEYYMIK